MTKLELEKTYGESKPVVFQHRVLLQPPVSRSISVFAIGADAGLAASAVWSVSATDKDKVLDRQTYGFLRRKDFGDYQFQVTRHKHSLRLAYYANWVAFDEKPNADKFENTQTGYGLFNLIADAKRRRETIEHNIENGMVKGRYDLSSIEPSKRYHKAKLFVDCMDEIRKLQHTSAKLEFLLAHLAQYPILT